MRPIDDLLDARHWVFDLDGTLTVAMHDFDALRRAIGCPPGAPILEWLERQPPHERQHKRRVLDAMEAELCDQARAAHGALSLVQLLRSRGCQLGIVTRNNKANALRTLDAIGMRKLFASEWVIGRDEAPSKPDPSGLLQLATTWGVQCTTLVMVGDFLFDLQAGRRAGAFTVHADADESSWPEYTDLRVRSLAELVRRLSGHEM